MATGRDQRRALAASWPAVRDRNSTTFAWRRFLTAAEGDAWVAENIVSGV